MTTGQPRGMRHDAREPKELTMTQVISTTDHPYETGVDLSREAFWAQPYRQRDESFAWLRKNAPVSWHRPLESFGYAHQEKGFWAITRAADIRYVSERHELFSSTKALMIRPTLQSPPSMLTTDPPEHERYRRMVSSAFTPKAVKKLSEQINERAAQIVERVRGAGQIDFVKEVSSRLPMLTVADMFGIPDDLIDEFTSAGDRWASATDPEIRPAGVTVVDFIQTQTEILWNIGVDVVKYRRKHPAEDLATALGNGTFDGRPLNDMEAGAIALLLSVAGNDTTKQTTGLSVYELWNAPDQKKLLVEDYDNLIVGAIEEFVRHGSPVQMFARTATQDCEIAGVPVAEDDKVVMLYASGNRDETLYEDPWRFDITRGRMPHVGFGGGGVHYCLGNAVAKAQLRALFSQFLDKLWDMEVGEPEILHNETFNGYRKFPVYIP